MSRANDRQNPPQGRRAGRITGLRDLAVTYEGHSESVVIRPPDLSTRGMFINTNQIFPEGAVLNVRFRLGRSDVEISARAEVRYTDLGSNTVACTSLSTNNECFSSPTQYRGQFSNQLWTAVVGVGYKF